VIDRWRKFVRLSRREKVLLGFAVLLLPTMALVLRVIGFRRLQTALSGIPIGSEMTLANGSIEQARRTARMVSVAARRGFYQANCLPQSLVLWVLLRRQAIQSDLRIGVRKENGKFEAHAWIEIQGAALNDLADVGLRFAPFAGAIDLTARQFGAKLQ
jgi:hypothetical protein